MTFTLYFPDKVDDELEKKVEVAFDEFIEEYNEKHEEAAIHDSGNVKRFGKIVEDEKTVQIWVDFGGCPPSGIKKLIQHLQRSGLGIQKAVVS